MSEQNRPSPADTKVQDAFDNLFEVGELPVDRHDAVDEQVSHEDWLSTGIRAFDRSLDGGIPPGHLVSFVALAETQGELILKQIAGQHDCLYITSLRPDWEVRETLADHVQMSGSVEAESIDICVEDLDPDARLGAAEKHIGQIEEESMVVIDSVNELEDESEPAYVEFLYHFKERLWESGSAGLLHCIEGDSRPPGREITYRLYDIIQQLRRSVHAGRIEYLLDVSKFRGCRARTEPIKLELTDEIEIDTSRDIA